MKLSLVHKICFTGLLLALTIICTRILSIQNIPVIPFVRISIGPSLIILSSLLLGPLCGAVVGAGSDMLGIVLFPNSLGYSINPFFTIVYGLLGVLPWVCYFLLKNVKKPRISGIFMFFSMILLSVFVLVFLLLNNSITLFGKEYIFEVWHKVLMITLSFVLTIGTCIAIYFTNKMMEKKFGEENVNTYNIGLVCLIAEVSLMLILNSIVKCVFFEVDFLFVFFAQAVVFFIDIPLNTFIVAYLMLLSKRVLLKRS